MDQTSLFTQIIFPSKEAFPTLKQDGVTPLGGGGTKYASFLIQNKEIHKLVPVDLNDPYLSDYIQRLNSNIPSLCNSYHIWPQSKIDFTSANNAPQQGMPIQRYCTYKRPYAPLLLSSYLKFPINCFRSLRLNFFIDMAFLSPLRKNNGSLYYFWTRYRIYIPRILFMGTYLCKM